LQRTIDAMNVLVTGSSSHLARALLPVMCADDSISRVTGVDIAPPHFSHEKFQATICDIREPRLTDILPGHDALVHLAYVVLRGRMRETEMADINVRCSYHLFKAARDADVKRLVHLSSAAVYGQGENVSEETPYAPLHGFLYGTHKAQLERLLEAGIQECVRLRPHVILGKNAQPLLLQLLNLPLYPALPRPYAKIQCVHEDDVAHAVLLAIKNDVHGPFNLAASDSFSYCELIQRRHRFALSLPPGLARAGLHTLWRLSGWGGEPAWLEGLDHTLTLDCRRANTVMGWQSRYNSSAAIMDALG
jgi:UDP-glucose 4-epimerase